MHKTTSYELKKIYEIMRIHVGLALHTINNYQKLFKVYWKKNLI